MKKLYLLAIVALAFIITRCASSKPAATPGVYINTEKLNGRTFHKLFVEVETVDVELRATVEKELVDALSSSKYEGVRSIDLIPFSLKDLKMPAEDEIRAKVKESGCDGILFISVSHKGETAEYNSGTVRKGNQQFGASVLGSALNKNGGDVKAIEPVNSQGSFIHNGADFIFGNNLYDVPGHELIFSVQSEPVEAASLDKSGKEYANWLVEQLKIGKLLKK